MARLFLWLNILPLLVIVVTSSSAKDFDDAFFRKNLQTKAYSIDSEANAVVLYENTTVEFVPFTNSSILERRMHVHRIIKIIDLDATDAINVHVYYPQEDKANGISAIKGTTYNLQEENIEKTALEGKNIFKKKNDAGLYSESFSMPNVKKGSVIEYSYIITTRSYESTLTWHLQKEYPEILTEFSIIYPSTFEFTTIAHVPLSPKSFPTEIAAEESNDSFCVVKKVLDGYQQSFWLRRNVSGINDEKFVINHANHLEQIELQITGYTSHFGPKHFSNSWQQINKELWETRDLKKHINKGNAFFDRTIDSLTTPNMSAYDKSAAIFNYVRSQYKMIPNDNSFLKLDLRYIYKYKEGSLAEINLLLTAMLLRAGIEAAPLILSTTNNISPNKDFPVLDRMDFMACVATIDSGYVVMDASDKNNSFGFLPIYCYNGYAWILGDTGKGINLTPDIIKDRTVYGIKMYDFTDSTAKIDITEKFGQFRSVAYRKEWAKHRDKTKSDLDELKKNLPENVEVTESHIENENDPDASLLIKYTCVMSFDKNIDNFYISEAMIKFFDKNPFPAKTRKLPIEFPYKTEVVYNMNVILPQNLKPDSVKAPVEIDCEKGGLHYKKTTNYFPDLHTFAITSSFSVNTTSFAISKYEAVKKFMQQMIDDNNKMIVLKNTNK